MIVKESHLYSPTVILNSVKEAFSVDSRPIIGPSFILPSGEFLNISMSDIEKYWNGNHVSYPFHGIVDDYLAFNKKVIDYADDGYRFCELTNSIKVNSGSNDTVYIALNSVAPTSEQYKSILKWLDFIYNIKDYVDVYEGVATSSKNYVRYYFNEYIPDDILKRIKRYYSSGTLYEYNNNCNKGDSIKMSLKKDNKNEAYIVKPDSRVLDKDDESTFDAMYYDRDFLITDPMSGHYCECEDCGWFGEKDELVRGKCPDCGGRDIVKESTNDTVEIIDYDEVVNKDLWDNNIQDAYATPIPTKSGETNLKIECDSRASLNKVVKLYDIKEDKYIIDSPIAHVVYIIKPAKNKRIISLINKKTIKEALRHSYVGMEDVDKNKFPLLHNALDLGAISLVVYDNDACYNEKFDVMTLQDEGISIDKVLKEIKDFCKEHKFNFYLDANYVESLNKCVVKESTFRGVPNTTFIWHGNWSDPEVSTTYNGKTYVANYWDIEESMYQYYLEEKKYSETKDDDYAKNLRTAYKFDSSDEDFEKFLVDNADQVTGDIIDMGNIRNDKLEEKGLTKAQRHNKMLNKIFDGKRKRDEDMLAFIKANSDLSDEELKKIADDDKISLKLKELGLHDAYWNNASLHESRKLNESFTDDERISALAKHLDIPESNIKNSYADNSYETDDGKEYWVVDEDEARELAEEDIENLWDDIGLQSFTPWFCDWIYDNAIDQDWFEDYFREYYETYLENIESEDDDKFENRLIQELYDEDILTDDDFIKGEDGDPDYSQLDEENVDMDSKKEEYVDLFMYRISDYAQEYRDQFGDESFKEVATNHNLIDLGEVIDKAIEEDGVAHFIADYDGDEIELGDGLYAYRTN